MRMTWAIALLVAANALALAWIRGDLDGLLGQGPAPERMRQQVDAQRIRVLPAEAAKADAVAETCVEFGPVDAVRAARLRELADAFAAQVRFEQQPASDPAAPPVAANARAAEGERFTVRLRWGAEPATDWAVRVSALLAELMLSPVACAAAPAGLVVPVAPAPPAR